MYGNQLRVLELGDHIPVQLDFPQHFLSHLPYLDVCRLGRLLAPPPFHANEDDDKEEDETHSTASSSDAYDSATPQWKAEYNDNPRFTSFPKNMGAAPICLTRLVVLESHVFAPQVSQWQLPALREVITAFDDAYWANDVPPALRTALAPHSAGLTHFTYVSGPEINIWGIVDALPSLRFLRTSSRNLAANYFQVYHPHLDTIVAVRNSSLDGNFETPLRLLATILPNALPALRSVRFVGGKDVGLTEQKTRLEFLGVTVTWS